MRPDQDVEEPKVPEPKAPHNPEPKAPEAPQDMPPADRQTDHA